MNQTVAEFRKPPVKLMERLIGKEMSESRRRRLRDALGGFATGVTLVLSRCGEFYHGMTANSFTAVSLDPPLVLVSISNMSKAAKVIHHTKKFSINLLCKEQEALSGHFAGRPNDSVSPDIKWTECGTPFLGDGLATFVCDLYQAHEAGDHTIFLGEVREYQQASEEPLVFFRGKYQNLLI